MRKGTEETVLISMGPDVLREFEMSVRHVNLNRHSICRFRTQKRGLR